MIIALGKCTLYWAKSEGGEPTGSWTKIDTPENQTTNLNVSEGDKIELTEEGGDVVDTYTGKSKVTASFTLFEKKGVNKPFEDVDGRVVDNYALRIVPEDPTIKGRQLDNCSVSVQSTFATNTGFKHTYTFTALKPKEGKMVKDYTEGTTSSSSSSTSAGA